MEPRLAVFSQMSGALGHLTALAETHGLIVMGGVHRSLEAAAQTLYLLGTGPQFWPIFTASPEYQDGETDPLNRWSIRILEGIQDDLKGGVGVVYPFTGPPYEPFLSWAQDCGEAWQSPVGMLVHKQAGLMISYRGAIVVAGMADLPPRPAQSPCVTCSGQPCATACPVDALSAERGYDVAACRAYLDSEGGRDCLTQGCKARRACPVSQEFGRDPAQSAFHMKAFHPS